MSNKTVLETLQAYLVEALDQNDYALSNIIQQKLIHYLELLLRWNQVFNLTAIRDPHDMVWLHILDSLSITPYLHGARLIDVGTGAGLPGIPLALTQPDKAFVLVDSNGKKIRFLTQVILELGIQNVEVVHARCEEMQPTVKFDSVISRAFSTIAVMLQSTQHLADDDGQFLAMKGVYPEQELENIPDNFKLLGVHKLKINGLAAERHLVCIGRK